MEVLQLLELSDSINSFRKDVKEIKVFRKSSQKYIQLHTPKKSPVPTLKDYQSNSDTNSEILFGS